MKSYIIMDLMRYSVSNSLYDLEEALVTYTMIKDSLTPEQAFHLREVINMIQEDIDETARNFLLNR